MQIANTNHIEQSSHEESARNMSLGSRGSRKNSQPIPMRIMFKSSRARTSNQPYKHKHNGDAQLFIDNTQNKANTSIPVNRYPIFEQELAEFEPLIQQNKGERGVNVNELPDNFPLHTQIMSEYRNYLHHFREGRNRQEVLGPNGLRREHRTFNKQGIISEGQRGLAETGRYTPGGTLQIVGQNQLGENIYIGSDISNIRPETSGETNYLYQKPKPRYSRMPIFRNRKIALSVSNSKRKLMKGGKYIQQITPEIVGTRIFNPAEKQVEMNKKVKMDKLRIMRLKLNKESIEKKGGVEVGKVVLRKETDEGGKILEGGVILEEMGQNNCENNNKGLVETKPMIQLFDLINTPPSSAHSNRTEVEVEGEEPEIHANSSFISTPLELGNVPSSATTSLNLGGVHGVSVKGPQNYSPQAQTQPVQRLAHLFTKEEIGQMSVREIDEINQMQFHLLYHQNLKKYENIESRLSKYPNLSFYERLIMSKMQTEGSHPMGPTFPGHTNKIISKYSDGANTSTKQKFVRNSPNKWKTHKSRPGGTGHGHRLVNSPLQPLLFQKQFIRTPQSQCQPLAYKSGSHFNNNSERERFQRVYAQLLKLRRQISEEPMKEKIFTLAFIEKHVDLGDTLVNEGNINQFIEFVKRGERPNPKMPIKQVIISQMGIINYTQTIEGTIVGADTLGVTLNPNSLTLGENSTMEKWANKSMPASRHIYSNRTANTANTSGLSTPKRTLRSRKASERSPTIHQFGHAKVENAGGKPLSRLPPRGREEFPLSKGSLGVVEQTLSSYIRKNEVFRPQTTPHSSQTSPRHTNNNIRANPNKFPSYPYTSVNTSKGAANSGNKTIVPAKAVGNISDGESEDRMKKNKLMLEHVILERVRTRCKTKEQIKHVFKGSVEPVLEVQQRLIEDQTKKCTRYANHYSNSSNMEF